MIEEIKIDRDQQIEKIRKKCRGMLEERDDVKIENINLLNKQIDELTVQVTSLQLQVEKSRKDSSKK